MNKTLRNFTLSIAIAAVLVTSGAVLSTLSASATTSRAIYLQHVTSAQKATNYARSYPTSSNISKAKTYVATLPNGQIKTDLTKKIAAANARCIYLQHVTLAQKASNYARCHPNVYNVNQAKINIATLPNGSIKTGLTKSIVYADRQAQANTITVAKYHLLKYSQTGSSQERSKSVSLILDVASDLSKKPLVIQITSISKKYHQSIPFSPAYMKAHHCI